MNITPRHKVK